MNFVDSEMDLVDLGMDFVDLGTNFVDLEVNFMDLEVNFVGLKIGFGDVGMNFMDLETGFVGLGMDFIDVAAHRETTRLFQLSSAGDPAIRPPELHRSSCRCLEMASSRHATTNLPPTQPHARTHQQSCCRRRPSLSLSLALTSSVNRN
ncbi:hypothetical protein T459_12099 [Capsicum annuum]|uniref:Uncharacterized protein n=1 Tax=Capsicum annuum TaxID=4072 RepID=A0A2G2ZNU7_CAPAN|nr:hypothetical protein T459_12099 [Capsicum annuum]